MNINIETAKTAELLAFYNAHADKPVNKFTNLETARRRVTALIEALEVSDRAHEAARAAKSATKAAKASEKNATKLADAVDKTVAIKAHAAEQAKAEPKTEKNTKAKPGYEVQHDNDGDKIVAATRRSNAAGIAASWLDNDIREARLYRQGVVVMIGKNAQEYNSTHAAFAALGLPMSKVIRFRMKLKEAKKLTFTHAGKNFEFSIL